MLDGLEMRYPRWYHLWANFNLTFLSTIEAVLQTIVRWVKCVAFFTVYFLRLDVKIFAGFFARMDKAWVGYWSMLYIENRFHNPIKKLFLAYLCQHRYSRADLHPSVATMIQVQALRLVCLTLNQSEAPLALACANAF